MGKTPKEQGAKEESRKNKGSLFKHILDRKEINLI